MSVIECELTAGVLRFRLVAWRQQTACSTRQVWLDRTGRYRVTRSRCRYGPRRGAGAVPVVCYAEARDQRGWRILSRHRKLGPAFKSCASAARAGPV